MNEKPAIVSPEDLQKNVERLQSELALVQNELHQALEVWRAILAADKQEFKKLVEDRETAWSREESAWDADRQAYEKKIHELEAFFTSQVGVTEKNAVRALQELDAAWKAERERWQDTVAQQVKESRQGEELQNASRQQLEQRLEQLTQENAQLQTAITESQVHQAETHSTFSNQEQQWQGQIASLESQATQLQEEKVSWQQALSEKTEELHQTEALLQSLQQEHVEIEARLRDAVEARAAQDQQMETYVASLEKQIASLQEFIQQVIPAHPQRRQTDQPLGPQRGSSTPQSGSGPWFPRVSR